DESKAGAGALRIVVAEDTVLLREGIVLLLEKGGHDVVGQTDNADDLLLKVRSYSPDVVVVDVRMPPTHTDEGLRAAREIRERHPGTGVLVLSSHLEPAYAAELVAEDASGVGYLLKDRVYDVDEFLSAVERVADGGAPVDAEGGCGLVGAASHGGGPDALGDRGGRGRGVVGGGR